MPEVWDDADFCPYCGACNLARGPMEHTNYHIRGIMMTSYFSPHLHYPDYILCDSCGYAFKVIRDFTTKDKDYRLLVTRKKEPVDQ